LTGHGLKDTASVMSDRMQPLSAPPEKAAILSILEKLQ
jgi:hypothetical protein